jgi:hypothetical protein
LPVTRHIIPAAQVDNLMSLDEAGDASETKASPGGSGALNSDSCDVSSDAWMASAVPVPLGEALRRDSGPTKDTESAGMAL